MVAVESASRPRAPFPRASARQAGPPRHGWTGLATALLLAALAGCQALKDTAGALLSGARPTARVTSARVGDLSLDALSVVVDVEVANPLDVALPLTALDWKLASSGHPLASGTVPDAPSIPAHGAATVPVVARLGFQDALAALAGVKPGVLVPWQADLEVHFEVPGAGPVNLPLSARGELPIPAPPSVSLTALKLDTMSLTDVAAHVELEVANANAFAATLEQFGLGFSLGTMHVAQLGLDAPRELPAGGTSRVSLPISFSPLSAGTAIVSMLKGDSAGYRLDGSLRLDTPYGPWQVPIAQDGNAPIRH